MWTAPSPSQAVRPRSPSLPPLPELSRHDPRTQVFQSPSQHQRSDSSAYYTALWGSPYEVPTSSIDQLRGHRHERSNSTITADGSPLRSLRKGKSHEPVSTLDGRDQAAKSDPPADPNVGRTAGPGLATARSDGSLRKPRYGFTQDWLRTHLASRKNSEKGNWWSDDSGNSDTDVGTAKVAAVQEDASEPWFDSDRSEGHESIQSPNRHAQEVNVRELSLHYQKRTVYHRALPSDETIKQKDFDEIFGRARQAKPVDDTMLQSIHAAPDVTSPAAKSPTAAEKPLPPPPVNRTVSEAPVLTSPVGPTESPVNAKRPSISGSLAFQRPRKRVLWRGKTCVIALPMEDGTISSKQYLKLQDRAARLAEWDSKGFSIRGFDLSERNDGEILPHGQSRDIYPDPRTWQQEWQERKYRVNIPDKKAWDDYVTHLKEEKLRALGVSFGDGKPPSRTSSALPSMGRQPSVQNVLLPPSSVTTMSASSSRSQMGHATSPSMAQNPFGRSPSMVSPVPQQYNNAPAGSRFPKQSVSLQNGQPYGPPAQFVMHQPAPPVPGGWAQQQHFNPQSGSQGVSPLVNGLGPNIRAAQSPVSPLGAMGHDGFFSEQAIAQRRMTLQNNAAQTLQQVPRQQPSPAQHLGPPQMTPNARPQSHADEVHPAMYISQPEIASPLPQGHRQNPSESLQREIDSAEYHLEESIRRQLDEEDELSLTSPTNDEGPFHGTLSNANGLRNGMAGTSQKSKTAMSDLETNPSLANSPSSIENDAQHAAPASGKPGHASKASVSKLNVNAREFVFDPLKSFTPSMFAFSGNTPAFNPASAPTAQVPEAKPQPKTNGTTFTKGLNVEAPAFTPGGFQKPSVPSREFSFSSAMPTLKPDAPTFTPGAAPFHATSGSDWSGSEKSALPRIFGNFDFSQAPTGGKKSKAIPIVKPLEVPSKDGRDSEGQEDETGRITQAEGRQKRARRAGDHGDSVPLFATPSPDVSREQSTALNMTPKGPTQKESVSLDDPVSGDDENQKSPAEKATGQLKDSLDELDASGASSSDEGRDQAEMDDKDLEPFEFNDAAEAADFNIARPRSSLSMKSKVSETKEVEVEVVEKPLEQEEQEFPADDRDEDTKVSLSATVQPYEYNPDPANFQFGPHAKPGSSASVSGLGASRYASGGDLGDSRYAPKQPSPEVSPPSLAAEILRGEESSSVARSPSVEQLPSPDTESLNPTYQEIDAVMKHLNEDSEAGVERIRPTQMHQSPIPSPVRSLILSPIPVYEDSSERDQRLFAAAQRKVPSASPNRLQQPFQYLPQREFGSSDSAAAELVQRNARFSPSYKPPRYNAMDLDSPVHRLNGEANLPISDWDDAVSSGEEAKFHSRSNFFDHKVNDLIGAAVQQRLQPLEKNLAEMSSSISRLLIRSESRRNRRSTSAEIENSDADDEDDDEEGSQARARSQARSPLKDRKYDKLKASLLETLSTQRQPAPTEEMSRIMETLAELKDSIQQQKSSPSVDIKSSAPADTKSVPPSDIKSIIEEAIAKQMRGKSAPIASSASSATAEKYQLQIAGLESMLKIAESRAEDDLKARRLAEDALADHQRLLRSAQAEAAEQRESAEETERSLRTFHEERLHDAQRTSLMEAAQMDFKRTITELTEKNSALEDTLEEYRLSSAQWREEIDEAKSDNRNLDRTINALKSELEDGIRGRRTLKAKLDKLQEEMTTAARNVARDQSLWRRREEEHKARHELQSARLEAEARTRERFQLEIERLESQEKEAMKSRFLVDQVQGENGRLVAMVNDLKAENDRVHKEFLHNQRELHDVKETGRLDIQRVQMAMEADMEKASHETQIVRRDLESVIARLQTQLGDARADAAAIKEKYEHTIEETKVSVARFKSKYEALLEDAKTDAATERSRHEALLKAAHTESETLKSRYEIMLEDAKSEAASIKSRYEIILEEASESRDTALREAAEAREAALKDHYQFHERTMEEMKGMHDRAMVAVREDRDRALKMVFEERQAVEANLKARLELEVDKAAHYQDRVTHLEEKLEIAKAAGQAAVQAAQSARASPSPTALASTVISRGSDVGGKISPQALRESILVLQEQLQQRESQIEKLQQELASLDKEAPAKIKDRDIEISWLRELLGVRIDDLQDIITTLSQPTYNREAVKDAAIRLKANLQMEQQEKERAMAGGQTFSSLASITNLTASPRALPFAAAAAIGNWGKGRFGSLAEMANGSASNTPSKSSPASMFSGLLTPPSTTLRQTPQPLAPSSRKGSVLSASSHRPLRGYQDQQSTPRQSISRQLNSEPPPETPRLLRQASYDQDAEVESGLYSLERYAREREDDESTVDGVGGDRGEEMFGPTIGA